MRELPKNLQSILEKGWEVSSGDLGIRPRLREQRQGDLMIRTMDDYSKYTKDELVQKIRLAIDQLNHVKVQNQHTLGLPPEKVELVNHSIDHAISELEGEPKTETLA